MSRKGAFGAAFLGLPQKITGYRFIFTIMRSILLADIGFKRKAFAATAASVVTDLFSVCGGSGGF